MNKTIVRRQANSQTLQLPDMPALFSRVFANRNVRDVSELDHSIAQLESFNRLQDIDRAVALLVTALQQDWQIVVVGDFDVDGATSTTVAVTALRAMGARRVNYMVPNRFKYGYGLTPEIVSDAINHYQPQLIITVDNGISSVQGVAAAKHHGVHVLITDHHLPGEELPAADAIVNPNQPSDQFPSKALAGVGVIFYVMLALRSSLREQGWFSQGSISEPNLAQWLDLVALGTVADVVPLDHNNRILVAQGLARIRAGQLRPGIQALIEVANRDAAKLVASDFGFAIAPRLNAAGRLEDMSLGIDCLLSEDIQQARRMAAELDSLNQARREIEADMKQQAETALTQMSLAETELPFGLCLFDPSWHEGVVGILASRIKDRWHRPVIAFAQSEQGMLKGSARSVSGLHIRDALDAIAAQHPSLISKFGGHAMAAGLTIAADSLADFTAAFDLEVRRHLAESDLQGVVLSDGELTGEDLNLTMAKALRYLVPWGQAFHEPVFDGVFELVQRRVVGERHLKLLLRLPGQNSVFDAIAFNTTDHDWPDTVQYLQLAYRLDVNDYQGQQNLQLMVEYLQPYAV